MSCAEVEKVRVVMKLFPQLTVGLFVLGSLSVSAETLQTIECKSIVHGEMTVVVESADPIDRGTMTIEMKNQEKEVFGIMLEGSESEFYFGAPINPTEDTVTPSSEEYVHGGRYGVASLMIFQTETLSDGAHQAIFQKDGNMFYMRCYK